ncbi:MAG TPA: YgiQ family radical SAM protein, partial [Syntrophorhabdus aromaticivorans]|nr:YgiQ family radical SAM protein [Syntrophorhabdus aromaticivorans]
CRRRPTRGTCSSRHCLTPEKCKNLHLGYGDSVKLYTEVLGLPKVKHVFLESGFRHDLLTGTYAANYLEHVVAHHISGRMKVAPEHNAGHVLELMNKPDFAVYETFAKRFRETSRRIGKEQYLVNYFISGHPGCTLEDTLALSLYLMKRRIHPEQIQDFIPLPMTLSGCMYYTEKNPFTGETLYVSKTFRERKMHRALIQYRNPGSGEYVKEALRIVGKEELLHTMTCARRGR